MNPLVIALIAGILYLIQITFIFNRFNIQNKAKLMVKLWVVNLPMVVAGCFIFDKYEIFGKIYQINNFEVSLFLTIFFYFAGFFGGILQLYNLADRGFSLRVLIDMEENIQQGVSLNNVMQRYSQGKGISWMYEKRLDDLSQNDLIFIFHNLVENTSRGNCLSRLFIQLRKIINLR